jgi:hypothetical protein
MHQCPNCPSSFARQSHLARHVRGKHTLLKPFRCLQCPIRFSRLDTVQKHLRIIHGLEKRKLTQNERVYVSDGFVEPSSREVLFAEEYPPPLQTEENQHIIMFEEMMQKATLEVSQDPPLPLYLQESIVDQQRRGSIPLDFSLGNMLYDLPEPPMVPSNYPSSMSFQMYPDASRLESFGIPFSAVEAILENTTYF